MLDYLTLRDKNFKTVKPIVVEEYVCSVGYSSSASNTFSFKMAKDEEEIPLGYFVTYGNTIMGGKIESKDFDLNTNTVTYYGVSFYGLLDNVVAETGTTDLTITVRAKADSPTGQSGISGTDYYKNGPYPYTHYVYNKFRLPYDRTFGEWYNLSSGSTVTVSIPLGSTLGQALEILAREMGAYGFRINLASDYRDIINVTWEYQYSYPIDITDRDSNSLIANDSLKPTGLISQSNISYVNTSGGIETRTIAQASNQKYTGSEAIYVWDNSSTTNRINEQKLRKLRKSVSNNLSTTYTVYNPEEIEDFLSYINIGDCLELNHRTINYQSGQLEINEMVFEMNGRNMKLEFKFGNS